jgi:creatinine amidohydrolase
LGNENFVYEAAYGALGAAEVDDARIVVMDSPFSQLAEGTMRTLFPNGFPGLGTDPTPLMETSPMLYLRPELVLGDRAVDDAAARMPGTTSSRRRPRFVPESGLCGRRHRRAGRTEDSAEANVVTQVGTPLSEELPPPRA